MNPAEGDHFGYEPLDARLMFIGKLAYPFLFDQVCCLILALFFRMGVSPMDVVRVA